MNRECISAHSNSAITDDRETGITSGPREGCVVTNKDYNKTVSDAVKAMREFAEKLKSNKQKLGKSAVEKLTAVKPYCEFYVYYGRTIAACSEVLVSLVGTVVRNKEARSLAETLVGNVVHDVASRVHESASLVEFVLKAPEVSGAFKTASKSLDDLQKVGDQMSGKPPKKTSEN